MMEKDDQFPNEKRRSPRVNGALVEYCVDGRSTDRKKAFIKDLCIHGICIYVPSPIDATSILCMDIYLFGSSEPIFGKGRIVWQKLGGYFNFYNVGIEFTEMSEEDTKTLTEHIEANYQEVD